jgi:SAM-dependent methyltransferase
MPTLEQNQSVWGRDYDWSRGGDEWSAAWGAVDLQWYMTLLPRIHRFVPAATVLELGPGFGRWTEYLKDLSERLILVDLSEKCIDFCRQRFASCRHIEYHVNDGRSLACVEDGSVDFIFSFDSLVHAEEDVMAAYIAQLAKKLRPEGVGFIHHSNLGRYARYYSITGVIRRGRGVLGRMGLVDPVHASWRAPSMTAEKFRSHADAAGLRCMSQELVNWDTRRLIDCISVFTRKTSSWEGSGAVVMNPRFMKEARNARLLSPIYGELGTTPGGRRNGGGDRT